MEQSDSDLSKIIGDKLKLRRIAMKLSQEQVAHSAGVATSTVQRMEAGTLNPTLTTLEEYCKAVEYSVAALFSAQEVNVKPTVHQAIEVLSDFVKAQAPISISHVPKPILEKLATADQAQIDAIGAVLGARHVTHDGEHRTHVKLRKKHS